MKNLIDFLIIMVVVAAYVSLANGQPYPPGPEWRQIGINQWEKVTYDPAIQQYWDRVKGAQPPTLSQFSKLVDRLEAANATKKPAAIPTAVSLPSAPPLLWRHDCACPSSASCNCPAGGCHCAENRPFNRAPLKWVPNGNQYLLKRLDTVIGVVNSTGDYYPVGADGECQQTPTKSPIPLPTKTSYVPVTTTICRT